MHLVYSLKFLQILQILLDCYVQYFLNFLFLCQQFAEGINFFPVVYRAVCPFIVCPTHDILRDLISYSFQDLNETSHRYLSCEWGLLKRNYHYYY